MKQLSTLFIVGLFFFPFTAYSANMHGTVRDAVTYHPLPGITVIFANVHTGEEVAAISDNDGHYVLKDIPKGTYNVFVMMEGMKFPIRVIDASKGGITSGDVYLYKEQMRRYIQSIRQKRPSI